MMYWDTSYIAKIYLREPGTDAVLQALAREGSFVCSEHGRLELMATFKRNQRESLITATQLKMIWGKHEQDLADGLIRYLPLSSELIQQACATLAALPPSIFLRAADALHLACAADAGLKEVHSHDRHLLAAAPHFGLEGRDIIP
jgi:predicted nucleic acid-binding protein